MLNPKAVRVKNQLNKVKKGGSSTEGFPKTDYTKSFNEFVGIDKLTESTEPTNQKKQVKPVPVTKPAGDIKFEMYDIPELDTSSMGGPRAASNTDYLLTKKGIVNKETLKNKKQEEEEENIADSEYRFAGAALRANKKATEAYNKLGDFRKSVASDAELQAAEEAEQELARKGEVSDVNITYGSSAAGSGVGTSYKTKPYIPFAKEIASITKKLKAEGKLKQYTPAEIETIAKETWQDNRRKDIINEKAQDYLSGASNIDEAGRKLIDRYSVAKGNKAAIDISKQSFVNEALTRSATAKVDQYVKLKNQLKPEGYKFNTQEEVDLENEKIKLLNDAQKEAQDLISMVEHGSSKLNDRKDALESAELEYDLLTRDYSQLGQLKKLGGHVEKLVGTITSFSNFVSEYTLDAAIGGVQYITENAGFEDTAKNIGKYTGKDFRESFGNAINEGIRVLDNELSTDYAKIRKVNSLETFLYKMEDLVISQAPTIALMAFTGGGSAAAEVGIGEMLTKAATLDGIAPKLLAAAGAGEKYSSMKNDMNHGIVGEDGNIIYPEYNALQMITAPLIHGYAEGASDSILGSILARGGKVLKAASVRPDKLLDDLVKVNAVNILKKMPKAWAKVQLEEQSAEQFTNVVQNFNDKVVLGKNVGILDNTGEVFKDTALMASLFGVAPHIAGAALSTLLPKEHNIELISNSEKMQRLLELTKTPGLSEVEINVYKKQIEKLSKKSGSIVGSMVSKLSDLSTGSYNSILNMAGALANIRNKAKEINDSDSPTKAEAIDALREEYNSIEKKFNLATGNLSRFEDITGKLSSDKKRLIYDEIVYSFLGQDNVNTALLEKEIENIYDEAGLLTEYKTAKNDPKGKFAKLANRDIDRLNKAVSDLGVDVDVTIADNSDAVKSILESKGFKYDSDTDGASNGFYQEGKKNENGEKIEKDFIVINRDNINKNGAFTTGQHELLHKVMNKAFEGNPELAVHMGNSLWKAVDTYLEGAAKDTSIGKRLAAYQKIYDDSNRTSEDFAKYVEETMPLFSEALSKGEIDYKKYNDFIEFIRGVIYKVLGIDADKEELLKLDSGEDVINFIKDYNKGYAKGQFSKAIKNFASKGQYSEVSEMDLASNETFSRKPTKTQSATANNRSYSLNYRDKSLPVEDRINALDAALDNDEIDFDSYEAEMKKLEFEEENGAPLVEEKPKQVVSENKAKADKIVISEEDAIKNVIRDNKATAASEKVQAIYDKKGVEGAYEIIKLFKPITAKIANKRRDAPGFNETDLINEIENGKGGLLELIMAYKPSSGVPLAAYINKNLPLRAITASKRLLGESFSQDVDEQKGLMATETADQTMTTQVAEKPKYADSIEAKVLDQEVFDSIKQKVLSTVRTLKTKLDEKVSINRTITPVISEIISELGKQADIDIKTALGGKKDGVLRRNLLKNKRYILENMTTTWLMGLDTKTGVSGGMPIAIQKRVNGKWLNYPDWAGQKIDRESVNTNMAGRTAGHELVRRLPNVYNNISDEAFLAQVLEPSGNPIRGRKESLSKAMAEEIALDLIKVDFAEEGELYDAFVANQTRLGVDTSIALVSEFNKQSDRGSVKYSLDIDMFKSIFNNSSAISSDLIRNNFSAKSITDAVKKYTNIDLDDTDAKAFSRSLLKSSFEKNKELSSKTIGVLTMANIKYIASEFNKNKLSGEDVVSIINKTAGGRLRLDQFRDADGELTPVGEKSVSIIQKELFGDLNDKDVAAELMKDDSKRNQAIKDFIDTTNSIYRYAYNKNNGGKYKSNADYMQKFFSKDSQLGKIAKGWDHTVKVDKKGRKTSHITLDNKIHKTYNFDVTSIDSKKKTLSNITAINDQSDRHLNLYVKAVNAFKSANDIEAGIAFTAAQSSNMKTNLALLAKLHGYETGVFDMNNMVWEHRPTRNDILTNTIEYYADKRDPDSFRNFLSTAKVFVVSNDFNTELNKIARNSDGINKDSYDIIAKKLDKEIVDINGVPLYNKDTNRRPSLNEDFNKILEETQGVKADKQFSDITARIEGSGKGKYRFFVPPSAEDFAGLLYDFMGKGKAGEAHAKFFQDNLIHPYVKGVERMDNIRANIKEGYKALRAEYPAESKKLKSNVEGKDFTYDQAVRVYLWQTNSIDVPGLSAKEITAMSNVVKKDKKLREFADKLSVASGQLNGWVEPTAYWNVESIVSDLHNATEKIGRRNILKDFIDNSNEIFSTENLNKIEAVLGTNYREALEDSLSRMKNGTNRSGGDKFSSAWTNWIANANGVIMFFNTRSAILQTIAATNYINWSDNNILAAGKAFLNQPQYWKDFSMIFNSNKMKERREGLKADVNEAELANAVRGSKNKAKAALSYLLKIGYTPTQMADSFAIAAGGATFYRNRVNTYLKQGLSQSDAESKAFEDFDNATEESQQSSDPSKLSQQQASTVGRLVLAFANTPMQYNRLMKKSFRDLVNGRGDVKTHVSKILYYGAVQNIIFSSLQNAMFAALFEDDEEDEKLAKEQAKKQDAKVNDILNGMADTILRGTGIYGAIASTAKNVVMKYMAEEEKGIKGDHTKTLIAGLGISPPIGSKAQKFYSAIQTKKYDADVIAKRGWGLTDNGKLNPSPKYDIAGKLIAVATNFPADRVVDKVNNVAEMLDSRNKTWQRIALGLGWNSYSVGVINEEDDLIKAEGKAVRKKEGIEKGKASRVAKSIAKQEEKVRKLDSIAKLPEDQIEQYYLNEEIKKQEEKVKKLDSISKLPEDQIEAYYAEKESKKKTAALKRKIRKQMMQ